MSGEISFNMEDYLEIERCKERLGDFIFFEYNEKGSKFFVLFVFNYVMFVIIIN